MSKDCKIKSAGGVAPFGYRWSNGSLTVDHDEAIVRKLIYELFLKHRRRKTVANLLNDLGHRTRSGSLFSDTTVDRLLKDVTAKGGRIVNGREVPPIISVETWAHVSRLMNQSNPAKQVTALFSGIVHCSCGGRMPLSSSSPKYSCVDCRRKIPSEDLEEIFHSQLKGLGPSEEVDLHELWQCLTSKDRRIIIEQICERIVIASDTIHIDFSYFPNSFKTAEDCPQNETRNETLDEHPIGVVISDSTEGLMSEAVAAKFLGISKITLLRKRNAGEINFFRVGTRVLYSMKAHLLPFLKSNENVKGSSG